MSEFTKTFKTYDEENMPGRRIATEIEKWIDDLDLDTINEEYVVIVEIRRPS